MIREQDFRHFYRSDVVHALAYTEKERKSIVLQIVLSFVVPLVCIPVLTVFYFETREELLLIPVVILAVGAPIYINKLFGDTQFYKNFKRKIIGKIIKYINPGMEYDNLLKVDDIEFDNSKFFDNTNTIIYGDDHVSGVINNAKVEFSELLVEYKSELDRKENDTKYQFRGLFFVAEFKYNFNSEFVIKTNTLPLPDKTPNAIDNERFNKLFNIKILKKPENLPSVLSGELLENLFQLQERIHNDFSLSFVGNKLYLGIVHDEDLFEPTLFATMMNYDKIKGYFDDLFYPILFVESAAKLFP